MPCQMWQARAQHLSRSTRRVRRRSFSMGGALFSGGKARRDTGKCRDVIHLGCRQEKMSVFAMHDRNLLGEPYA